MADGTEGFAETGDGTETGETEETPLIKQLRGQLKAQEKGIAEAAAARRELAFLKAGIDTSTKLGTLFAKSYDGDLSDSDKLKAEATELGLLKAAPTEEAERTPDNSSTERSNLATGAAPDDGKGVNPRLAARSLAEAALKNGATFDEAGGTLVAELARAAMSGDQSVIIKGRAY